MGMGYPILQKFADIVLQQALAIVLGALPVTHFLRNTSTPFYRESDCMVRIHLSPTFYLCDFFNSETVTMFDIVGTSNNLKLAVVTDSKLCADLLEPL